MRKLIVSLAFTAALPAAGFGCSSSTDAAEGVAGETAATGTSSTGGSSSVVIGTGGSGYGATSGSAGSGVVGSAGACTGTTTTGQKGDDAVVLFLVDTSLSMGEPPGGRGGHGTTGGTSKLASTQTALNSAFTELSPSLDVGLVFFPHVPVGTMPCFDPTVEVPIAPLDAAHLGQLTTEVSGVKADGSTPTHDAFAFAVETLKNTTSQGDKYIVLITDGEPTYTLGCVGTGMGGQMLDNEPLIAAVGAAYATDGIKTFVVGSPGSEDARTSLSAMARVGGTGPADCMDTGAPEYCHFDMTDSTDFGASLTTALGTITDEIPVDCAFDLPQPPTGMQLDLNQIDITVTNDNGTTTAIARDPAGDCATDGWVYVGDPPTGVQLCGALCDAVNAQVSPAIEVEYGCGQRVNEPR